MRDDSPINRRAFFRFGLRRLAERALDAAGPVSRMVEQLSASSAEAVPAPPASRPPRRVSLEIVLRPPGARQEESFLELCSRCGDCAKVCPVRAIQLDSGGHKGGGAPWIDANAMACALCDGLYCMHACPTGALVPTPLFEIDMGTARWSETMCLRSSGENCTICIDHCPIGTAAIHLDEGKIRVNDHACTGCGVCQHDCPTDPKAIIVIPRSARP